MRKINLRALSERGKRALSMYMQDTSKRVKVTVVSEQPYEICFEFIDGTNPKRFQMIAGISGVLFKTFRCVHDKDWMVVE